MALILNIETASTVCSVCLARDGHALAHAQGAEGNEHAGKLTLFIDEVMRNANLPYSQLDAVAVSSGPGSYTGLRIGTSVAKGLCYALNKPLIAIPTLLALAEGIKGNDTVTGGVYMPVLDARRMDIYTAIYDTWGNELRPAAMFTVNEEFEAGIAQYASIVIGGNAMEKFRSAMHGNHLHFIENIACDARNMVVVAEEKYKAAVFEDTAYFQPFYLHEFQPKLKARKENC